MLAEVLVRALGGNVHVARIPLVFRGGHGIHTPVDEDAKLGVFVPLRLQIFVQRSPVCAEGTVVLLLLLDGEKAVALGVIFGDGLLPLAVDLHRGFNTLGGGQRIGGLRRE